MLNFQIFNYNHIIHIIPRYNFQITMKTNILYEIKKQALKKANPRYQPNSQDFDRRREIDRLNTIIRSQDSKIVRLQAKIVDLNNKIIMYQTQNKLSFDSQKSQTDRALQMFSQVPMLLENKELKQNADLLHKENLDLNSKNNVLQGQMRQLKADYKRLQTKVKELQILEQLRQQRFKDQVDALTPIIVEQPQEYVILKQGIWHTINYFRYKLVGVVFHIFQVSAKDCQKQKKTNSLTIFLNYWKILKDNQKTGFGALSLAYKELIKLYKLIKEDYPSLDQEKYRDTMNQWIINSCIEISNTPDTKILENKLFRLLGVLYRSKFPIKGEQFTVDIDVKQQLQHLICLQVQGLLNTSKQSN